jgi:hypothetical protein
LVAVCKTVGITYVGSNPTPANSPTASSGSPRWTIQPPNCCSRFVAAAYERRSLGIGSHWPFEAWGRFLPEHTTAVSLLDQLLHHCHTVITDGESYRMRQARQRGGTKINKP